MMGSNRGGKELSLVGSNEVPSQVSRVSQIPVSTAVLHSSAESIQPVQAEPYPTRLLMAGNHDPMSDVQGRFSQLPANQKREFMNWMLRNLNSSNVDLGTAESREKQAASNAQAAVVEVGESLNKFPREISVSTGSFSLPTTQEWKVNIERSGTSVVPSQSQVLSGVQALPYEVGVSTSSGGGTVSYIPMVAASQSTSGLSYATPIYSTDLISTGEQISYVQPVTHETRTPQHAQVIGHISELQGNREISVVVTNAPTTPTVVANTSIQSHTSQILDTEGIVTVTPVMLMPGATVPASVSAGQEQIVQHVDNNQEPIQPVQEPLMVIKDIKTSEDAYVQDQPEGQEEEKKRPVSLVKGRNKKKKRNGRRSPCDDCKKYFHLALDDTKRYRVWRERTHVCPHCDKMFRNRQHLKVHERIHTGVKPYVCGTCNKAFTQSSAAKAHFMLHSMPKPFTCEICNKSVTTKGNLKLHMALHTGTKPFACRFCNKQFPRKSNLDQHILVHTGEKPHPCQYCGKLFRTPTSRATHERIHTGEKPYACRYCGKAFSDRRNFTSHERIHTGGYSCETCGKCFSDRRRVKTHQCKGYMVQQPQVQQPQQLQQQQLQQQQTVDAPTIRQQLEFPSIEPHHQQVQQLQQEPQQHHQLQQEQPQEQQQQQQQQHPDAQQLQQQMTTL